MGIGREGKERKGKERSIYIDGQSVDYRNRCFNSRDRKLGILNHIIILYHLIILEDQGQIHTCKFHGNTSEAGEDKQKRKP